ncbi:MAG: DNA-processing protein DprA [Clostridia bacterium]|nr:DNA-processing protein DprA [Clostridia bacterium]
MKNEILHVWLQLALGISSRLAREILQRFESIADVYNCDDFSFLGKDREKYIKRLESKDTSDAFEVVKRCEAIGARIIGFFDEYYPSGLRNIESPPVALYAIGVLKNLNTIPKIAVVGTRKMSDYGRNIAESFSHDFVKSGACVVSGLAKGVDLAAHRGAVMAGGYTVGVLGTPIGTIYPAENEKAFRVLYERGLVISEMYPGCPRTRADFPNRNRIISGMSDAVVIAEAGEGSGSLITAQYAISQGKTVFAVPGTIGAENAGTNGLIKKGVPPATSSFDVISPLSLEYPTKIKPYEYASAPVLDPRQTAERSAAKPLLKNTEQKKEDLSAESAPLAEKASSGNVSERITKLLRESAKPLSADELAAKTGINITDILTELTMLEIDGEVVASVGGRYSSSKR